MEVIVVEKETAPALRWLISFDLIHVPRLNPKPFTLAIN